MSRSAFWSKLLVNLGLQLDRENKFDVADECFRAANRICTRPIFITKQTIIKRFCRPALLADKKAERAQIEREIRRLKAGECRTLTEALFQDLTRIKKDIARLESAQ